MPIPRGSVGLGGVNLGHPIRRSHWQRQSLTEEYAASRPGLPRYKLLGMSEQSGGLTLHLQRVVSAPPPAVFRMHTGPDLFVQWFGPEGFSARIAQFDVRVGGCYRFWMQPPEGERFAITGEFRGVDPPERLVYTFLYDTPDPDDRETVVAFALRAVDTS